MARRVISEQDLLPAPVQPHLPQPHGPQGGWPLAEFDPTAAPAPHERGSGSRVFVVIGVVTLVVAAALAGFFGGRATRPSDAAIAERLATAERQQQSEARRAQSDALADQKRELDRQRNQAVSRATNRARKSGEASGRAQGEAAGRASGVEEGRAVGRDEGFEDGTCYTPSFPRTYVC